MSDASGGEGWWQASDGKWYPPEQHPSAAVPSATVPDASEPAATPPASDGDVSPGEGWWQASDGKWYPPEQHPSATVPEAAAPKAAPPVPAAPAPTQAVTTSPPTSPTTSPAADGRGGFLRARLFGVPSWILATAGVIVVAVVGFVLLSGDSGTDSSASSEPGGDGSEVLASVTQSDDRLDVYAVPLGASIEGVDPVISDVGTMLLVPTTRGDFRSFGGQVDGLYAVTTGEPFEPGLPIQSQKLDRELVIINPRTGDTDVVLEGQLIAGYNADVDRLLASVSNFPDEVDADNPPTDSCYAGVGPGYGPLRLIVEARTCDVDAIPGLILASDPAFTTAYDYSGDVVWTFDDLRGRIVGPDATTMVVIRETADGQPMFELLALPDGATTASTEALSNVRLFSFTGDTALVGFARGSEPSIGLFSADGLTELTTVTGLGRMEVSADLVNGARHALVLSSTPEGGSMEVFDIGTGEQTARVEGQTVKFLPQREGERNDGAIVMVTGDGRTEFHSIDPANGSATLVFTAELDLEPQSFPLVTPEFDFLHLPMQYERDGEDVRVLVSLDQRANVGAVLETGGFLSLQLQTTEGAAAVTSSVDDETSLYWLTPSSGFDPVVVDTGQRISNVDIETEGTLIYGHVADDRETIRRLDVSSLGADPETVQDGVLLQATGWEQPMGAAGEFRPDE